MSAAVAIGALAAAGTYLLLQRGLVRVAIGLVLIQHAIGVLLVTARSGPGAAVPIAPYGGEPADPLAHAFLLTAIVIGLGTTVFLLALALRHTREHRDDDVEDDVEQEGAA